MGHHLVAVPEIDIELVNGLMDVLVQRAASVQRLWVRLFQFSEPELVAGLFAAHLCWAVGQAYRAWPRQNLTPIRIKVDRLLHVHIENWKLAWIRSSALSPMKAG
jgi:hypothetical protein